MEPQFGCGRLGIMEIWVLDAGVFSSHSLYMSNAEITWALIIPLGERYEKPGEGHWKKHHITNFLSFLEQWLALYFF